MSEKFSLEADTEAYLEMVYNMNEGQNKLSSFLNNIFGYLYNHHPDELFGTNQIDGQHLVNQSFCKWRHKYLNEKAQRSSKAQSNKEDIISSDQDFDNIPPMAISEVEIETSNEVSEFSKSNDQPSIRSEKERERVSLAYFDSSNGADRGTYAWTQSIEDIEVRVPVTKAIEKGKQVNVILKSSSLEVKLCNAGTSEWVTHVSGTLLYPIKVEDSLWSLSPKQHVLINLEKSEERWWNKLLKSEEEIDLNKINAERDYGTLPEEDRSKIQEIVWNKHQKDQGKQTSDALIMQSVLRDAWNAEGSPFKGQPYDPSAVNFATGGSFTT